MRAILSVFALAVLFTCAVPAQTNAPLQSLGSPAVWPHKLVQKWKVSHGTDSTPALVGDRLYILVAEPGSLEVTYCLNTEGGQEIWVQRQHAGGEAQGTAPVGHPGPGASPSVLGDNMAILGATSVLTFLNAYTGKAIFRSDLPEEYPKFFTTRSPVMTGGDCVSFQLGEDDGTISCIEVATGRKKWSVANDTPSYRSPVLMTVGDTKLVIVQTEKTIAAINLANGKVVWRESPEWNGLEYNATTPIVDGQTLIYAGDKRGTIAVRLEKDGGTFTGKELWSNSGLSPRFNTLLLKDGLLYGLNHGGNFMCVNARTGKTAWTEPLGGHGAYGSIVDGGTVLFAMTPEGKLIVMQPGDKAYTDLGSIKVTDKPVYAAPVVSGNRIFIQDQESLTLWMIE